MNNEETLKAILDQIKKLNATMTAMSATINGSTKTKQLLTDGTNK